MRPAQLARMVSALLVMAASVLSMTTVMSAEQRALPSFTIAAIDGAPVTSEALVRDGTWLLVYVQPRCPSCDVLLERLDSDERPSASRIVIVGGGMDTGAVKALADKYPNLKTSRWLADPERHVVETLDVQASPTALGLRGSTIAWRLAGTVQNRRELDSILFTWLEKR